MSVVCDQISQEIGELFSCTQIDSHVRIRTPFLYPDGDVVDLYLKPSDSSGGPATRGERLVGRSGRSWTIDFHTRAPSRSSLVCVLATGSKAAARPVTKHVLATWHDRSHMQRGARIPAAGVALRRHDGRLVSGGLSSAGDDLVDREVVQTGRVQRAHRGLTPEADTEPGIVTLAAASWNAILYNNLYSK